MADLLIRCLPYLAGDLIRAVSVLIAFGRDPRHVLEQVPAYRADILADFRFKHLYFLGGYLDRWSEDYARVEVVKDPVAYTDGGLRRVAHPIVRGCLQVVLEALAQSVQDLHTSGVVADSDIGHGRRITGYDLALSCYLLALDLACARRVAPVDGRPHDPSLPEGSRPCASAM